MIGIAGGSASGKVSFNLLGLLPTRCLSLSQSTLHMCSLSLCCLCLQTSVAREILRQLDHVPNVLILSQDSFYRHHDEEEIALAFANELDFDHPSAIDFGLFKEVLEELRLGNSVEVSPHRLAMGSTRRLYRI